MTESDYLDPAAVSAFVLVADLRNFTRAAEALGTTQSAVSLRIKRLEERLGRRLLERTPRSVKVSADGEAFLADARAFAEAHRRALGTFARGTRRLRLGVSDQLVGADLPPLLKALAGADPRLVIGLDIAPSRALLTRYDGGEIDAAIVLRHDGERRDGAVLGTERLVWAAMPDVPRAAPLRLATHSEGCGVRDLALRALERAGIAWVETFKGGGIGSVAAAVSAGLAVAAMARRTAPAASLDAGERLGLPALPRIEIVLHARTSDGHARAALRILAAAYERG